jgi:hypothetical protein
MTDFPTRAATGTGTTNFAHYSPSGMGSARTVTDKLQRQLLSAYKTVRQKTRKIMIVTTVMTMTDSTGEVDDDDDDSMLLDVLLD